MDSADVPATSATPSIADSNVPVDTDNCALLGGFALVVQAFMGFAVLASLILKRAREKNKRTWPVWLGDISKQVAGQAFVHMANILISDSMSNAQHNNACAYYGLNILIDTTLGVAILWFIHLKLIRYLALVFPTDFVVGEYGTPFRISTWAKQAAAYVFALSAMKVIVVVLLWLMPWLFDIFDKVLDLLPTKKTEVISVMLVLPICMNIFQSLMVDSFLKAPEHDSDYRPLSSPSHQISSSYDFELPPEQDNNSNNATLAAPTPRRVLAHLVNTESLPRPRPAFGEGDSLAKSSSHSYPPAEVIRVRTPDYSPESTLDLS